MTMSEEELKEFAKYWWDQGWEKGGQAMSSSTVDVVFREYDVFSKGLLAAIARDQPTLSVEQVVMLLLKSGQPMSKCPE